MKAELLGLLAQAVIFLLGLIVSVGLGILLALRFDGAGPLLVVTILAAAGLLGGAALSQIIREKIVADLD